MTLASEIAADSPAAVWWLEETSGTTLVDSSGNGRNGTIDAGVTLNATGIIQTRVGGAWDVDGIEGGEVATGTWADSTTGITAEVWVQFDTMPGANGAVVMGRAAVSGANSRANKAWSITVTSAGAVLGRIYSNTSATAVPTSANGVITTGTLYHLAFVQTTTAATFYVNGTQVATAALSGGPVTYANNTRPISIGRQNPINTYAMDGRVQAAAYYTTALSLDRLRAHRAAALSTHRDSRLEVRSPALAGGDPSTATLAAAVERVALVSALGAGSAAGTEVTGGNYARLTPSWQSAGSQERQAGTAPVVTAMPAGEVRGWEGWNAAGSTLATRGLLAPTGYGLAIAATDRIQWEPNHQANYDDAGAVIEFTFPNGTPIVFAEDYTPAGLTAHARYYVINADRYGFQVATTVGGAAVNISADTPSDKLAVWGTVHVTAANEPLGPFVFDIHRRPDSEIVSSLRPRMAAEL